MEQNHSTKFFSLLPEFITKIHETKLKCKKLKKYLRKKFLFPELNKPAKVLSKCQNESLDILLRNSSFAQYKKDKWFSLVEFNNYDRNTMALTIANEISSTIDFGEKLVYLYSAFGDNKAVFENLKMIVQKQIKAENIIQIIQRAFGICEDTIQKHHHVLIMPQKLASEKRKRKNGIPSAVKTKLRNNQALQDLACSLFNDMQNVLVKSNNLLKRFKSEEIVPEQRNILVRDAGTVCRNTQHAITVLLSIFPECQKNRELLYEGVSSDIHTDILSFREQLESIRSDSETLQQQCRSLRSKILYEKVKLFLQSNKSSVWLVDMMVKLI